jgi:hypothetical protein
MFAPRFSAKSVLDYRSRVVMQVGIRDRVRIMEILRE